MPKIELDVNSLWESLGEKYDLLKFNDYLAVAKAEIDSYNQETGKIKIEFNDTNRPDLWSRMGLTRQLNSYLKGKQRSYDFFSGEKSYKDHSNRVIYVKKGLKNIRPYFSGFIAKGRVISNLLLEELVQMQERLVWNYGQKRKGLSVGMYRSDLLSYPLFYEPCNPKKTKFVPLGEDKSYTLLEVLENFPKGKEFGEILRPFEKHPIFKDANGEILSYPPILNSEKFGGVRVGDSEIFIELTGVFLDSLWLATAVVSCALSDLGFTIEPVRVEYEDGVSYTTPLFFQKERSFTLSYLSKIVGKAFTQEMASCALAKMGLTDVRFEGETGIITPPPYRNDFLHAVDIIEDIIIGYGLENLTSSNTYEYSPGSIMPIEGLSRRVRSLMVGMGFQEMLYNYLGSKVDFIEKMGQKEEDFILISNPMTENYEVVRNSIFPNLLVSEASSSHTSYPHSIFEIGKVVRRSIIDPTGSETQNLMSWLYAGEEASFSKIYAQISAFFYYFCLSWKLIELEDSRFIGGRSASIIVKDKMVGIMGEVHPQVLMNYGIVIPSVLAEINLDQLLIIL